ncbi:hypothetical protein P4E94_19065 [Pontiellaceae bacterium B12219]|nr:hypothetical protein [Pontiellaceae bacterium B12219]
MKSIIRYALATTALTFLSGQIATAQERVWTDNYGHKITAELIENVHGDVTLQTEAGKEIHIKISELSSDDQLFVLKNTPPDFDISVVEITDRENQGFDLGGDDDDDNSFQIQTSNNKYKATLTKDSPQDYDGQIQAELYIFGLRENADEFILLDKTVVDVTMDQANNDDGFSFTSGQTTTKELEGNLTGGVEYFGNLVVLVDEKGNVFETHGSRSRMEEFTAFIRRMQQGAVVTKNQLAALKNESNQ